jgi:creatinine amidohydrolase
MFPDQLELAYAECPVVYFAYGLCEPHGPACTLGLDMLKAHAICVEAARAHGGIVAPPDYWHIHEIGGYAHWAAQHVGEVERTWATVMPPWQHFRNVLYHIRTADSHKFHAAILVTGHYGPNWNDLKTICELVQPHVGTRLYSLPDFEANTPGFDGDGHSGGDHAGKVETSLLMAVAPECVDLTRVPAPDEPGPHFAMGPNVRESNRQTGERMVADEVRYLGDVARRLLAEYDQAKPEHRLRTFEQTERLWRDVVRPEFGEFLTMQYQWNNAALVPESSVWYENSHIPENWES